MPSGKKHTLDIEYSQVYYDSKGGEEDLDGISLILRSVPIDISVRKKGDKASMNDRILIQKDSTVEFAIHPDFFDKEADPQIDDFITWEYNKVNGSGSLKGWTPFKDTKGATASYTFQYGGIYQIRAKVGKEYFMYEIRKAAPFCYGNANLQKGSPDYVGVTNLDTEIKAIEQAYSCLGAGNYAKNVAIQGRLGYGVDDHDLDYNGDPKCNLFVFVENNKVNLSVPTELDYIQHRFEWNHEIQLAPRVGSWKNKDFMMNNHVDYDRTKKIISHWRWLDPAQLDPQPGYVVTGAFHCGILDYDGSWINAGTDNVNKKVHLLFPAPQYMLNSMREFKVDK